jgi:hypothetical protein
MEHPNHVIADITALLVALYLALGVIQVILPVAV